MGYNTEFSLQTTTRSLKEYRQIENQKQSDNPDPDWYNKIFPALVLGDGRAGGKFYDHPQQMSDVSKEYPDEVFILYGNGDEPDDIWREAYQNGVRYSGRTLLIYEPIKLGSSDIVIPEKRNFLMDN